MIGYDGGMFLFKMYGGFDMCGIDVGCEFCEVHVSFLKCHSAAGD